MKQIKSETYERSLRDDTTGKEFRVDIIKTLEEGDEPTEGWRETHTIYGNLTEMNREDIMNALARQERSSQYGGQRNVSAPRILTCNPITTIMVQSGGLDI
jgi:hypothetical protein